MGWNWVFSTRSLQKLVIDSVNSEHCGAIKDRDGMELGIFYKVFAEIGD